MNDKAIKQAIDRFERAASAASRLGTANSFIEAEIQWSDFLHHVSVIYSKLRNGACSTGKSEAWFGRINNFRKNDPLLCYVHQARNANEHGIEAITERATKQRAMVNAPAPYGGELVIEYDGDALATLTVSDETGRALPFDLIETVLVARLKPVVSRGVTYLVPGHHLGIGIDTPTPAEIARLCLAYLGGMLDEAKQRVTL